MAEFSRYRIGFYVEVEQDGLDSGDAINRAIGNSDRILDLDWSPRVEPGRSFFIPREPNHTDLSLATTLRRSMPVYAYEVSHG